MDANPESITLGDLESNTLEEHFQEEFTRLEAQANKFSDIIERTGAEWAFEAYNKTIERIQKLEGLYETRDTLLNSHKDDTVAYWYPSRKTPRDPVAQLPTQIAGASNAPANLVEAKETLIGATKPDGRKGHVNRLKRGCDTLVMVDGTLCRKRVPKLTTAPTQAKNASPALLHRLTKMIAQEIEEGPKSLNQIVADEFERAFEMALAS
jgi:hypothetical protein